LYPSRDARPRPQTAVHRVDHVIPQVPVRQWVLSLPVTRLLMLAAQHELFTAVSGGLPRVFERHVPDGAGLVAGQGPGGAVTLIQRFGSAANLMKHPQYPRYASD